MQDDNNFTLINSQNGNLAFKLFSFSDNNYFDHLQRNNFYSLIWIKNGDGLLKVDFSEYLFQENTIFSFAPYQPFLFSTNKKIEGIAIQFHSDFYCIHKNPQETNCDKVLFNNIYQEPFIKIDKSDEAKISQQIEQLLVELQHKDSNSHELLIPILKIFLVTISRIKSQQHNNNPNLLKQKHRLF